MKIRVYIAAPYTKPDPAENTHKAMSMWFKLASLGFAPFCPHLTHFLHLMSPQPYELWLEQDAEWVKVCHAVYRMPGESPGADKEVKIAKEFGIPVFYSVTDLVTAFNENSS